MFSILQRSFFVKGVSMYSWLVTVLLLASAANSRGQGAMGGGVGLRVYHLGLYPFPSQVHKCPSQATHVHNLTSLHLLMMINALSVEDFGRVLSRKEHVLLY